MAGTHWAERRTAVPFHGTERVEQVNEYGTVASFATPIIDHVPPTSSGGLRVAGRLATDVALGLERRVALLDELETLAERRADLSRSAQLLGGHDNGDRPAPPDLGGRSDARHRLTTAVASVNRLEAEFDSLKRAANEGTR